MTSAIPVQYTAGQSVVQSTALVLQGHGSEASSVAMINDIFTSIPFSAFQIYELSYIAAIFSSKDDMIQLEHKSINTCISRV